MKGCTFEWSRVVQHSFENLKKKIKMTLVLTLPNFSKVVKVDCDASIVAIGTTLSHEGGEIAYFNEMLNEAIIKYLMYHLESYAIR
jgi:hypothetical protein